MNERAFLLGTALTPPLAPRWCVELLVDGRPHRLGSCMTAVPGGIA